MSWNPFNLLNSSIPKKAVLSEEEVDFKCQVEKLDELEILTRRLYKDGKRLTEANAAVAKTERKLGHDMYNTSLCQIEKSFEWYVKEWDAAHAKMDLHMLETNSTMYRTVLEPLKKYISIFPYAQVAVKKREHSLQEYRKCQDKVKKYQERERTGVNLVKLETSKKALMTAQTDFAALNATLSEDIPKMIGDRTNYFQPSLEALIKSQVQYTTEAVKVLGELSNTMKGNLKETSKGEYASQIQQALTDIKALSITTD